MEHLWLGERRWRRLAEASMSEFRAGLQAFRVCVSASYARPFPRPILKSAGREYRAAIKGKARPCGRGFPDGLHQRHHAAPELVLAAYVHIILAHEVKLAIGTDSINRKARGKHLDGGAIAHRERDLTRSDQHPSGRIEREGAQRNA